MRGFVLTTQSLDLPQAASRVDDIFGLIRPERMRRLREKLESKLERHDENAESALRFLETVLAQEVDVYRLQRVGLADATGAYLETMVDIGAPSVASEEVGESLTQDFLHLPQQGGIDFDSFEKAAGSGGDQVEVMVVDSGWKPVGRVLPEVSVVDAEGDAPRLEGADGHVFADHGNAMLGVLVGGPPLRGIARNCTPRLAKVDPRPGSPYLGIAAYDVFDEIAEGLMSFQGPGVMVVALDAIKLLGQKNTPRLGLEAWTAARAVFVLADRLGVIPVVSAGNGHAADLERFSSQEFWPSPAIVVGGGMPRKDERFIDSNQGPRVNLHSWGTEVTTLTDDGYTRLFDGTSSATAIVAGVVAAVQSHVLKKTGKPLRSRQMRDLLVDTGYWGDSNIGPRPDLKKVRERLEEVRYDLDRI